jgi:hypothetical protein
LLGLTHQTLYNTSKLHFSPLLASIIEALSGDFQHLAIDVILQCCNFKEGLMITDWSILASALIDTVLAHGPFSKQKCLLAATIVSRADAATSRSITQKIFERYRSQAQDQINVFCQLAGKLNDSTFHRWILEEFVR